MLSHSLQVYLKTYLFTSEACFGRPYLSLGDIPSVLTLQHYIQTFSKASGLQANASNSALYTTGITREIKEAIRELTQFSFGAFPFKYLGISLSTKRLYIAECKHIADKMTSRIRGWQAKNLLYAAKLQLINSVMMGVSYYWCQMFILPKRVIKCINNICRSFLWFGIANSHKPGNVNLKQVCKQMKCGRLGIRDVHVWNQIVVGKIAWHIRIMKDSMWVRWVHGVYTKRGTWALYNDPITGSWTLRKLCKIKDTWKEKILICQKKE